MDTHMNPTEKTPHQPPNHDGPAHRTEAVPAAVWTVERVQALGVTTTLTTAASILGISRSQAYRLAATDTFPAPLIRAGTRIIVPVAGLLQLLMLDHPDPSPAAGGRGLEPSAESSVDATTPPPAGYTHHRWRRHTEHPGDTT